MSANSARMKSERKAKARAKAKRKKAKSGGEKVVVTCYCGKKYRVSAKRIGTSFDCRLCARDVFVEQQENVSIRTRAAVLNELGIDLDAADETYQNERAHSTRRRREKVEATVRVDPGSQYRCTECGENVEEPGRAYTEDGLVCEDCQAAAVIHIDEASRAAAAGEAAPARRKPGQVAAETDHRSVGTAKAKGAGMAAICFLGFSGLGGLAVGGTVATLIAPAALAAVAGWLVYGQNRPSA